jgi:hypothetical protein
MREEHEASVGGIEKKEKFLATSELLSPDFLMLSSFLWLELLLDAQIAF